MKFSILDSDFFIVQFRTELETSYYLLVRCMIKKYSEQELDAAKSEEKLKLECEFCHKDFWKTAKTIRSFLSLNRRSRTDCCKFCSNYCANKSSLLQKEYSCKFCSKSVWRCPSSITKSGNIFCNASCSAKHNNLNRKKSEETKRKISNSLRKNSTSTLALTVTKECDNCRTLFEFVKRAKVRKFCNACCRVRPPLSAEHRKKLSDAYLKRVIKNIPNYFSGRIKKGWYKGIWCDSSWELAWVLYAEYHGISFERNKEFLEYTFRNEQFKYYPDFKLLDLNAEKAFVEIKGWENEKFVEKEKQHGDKVLVLRKKELQPILKWVKEQYGTNFVKLYDSTIEN